MNKLQRAHDFLKEQKMDFDRIIESWGGDNSDAMSALFNEHVPPQGPAKTMYGELIRAVNRVGYRYWNDGDLYFRDYGVQTCGDAALWLKYNGSKEIQHLIGAMEGMSEDEYDQACDQLVAFAVNLPEEDKQRLLALPSDDHQSDKYNDEAMETWDPICRGCRRRTSECSCYCDQCGNLVDSCTCYEDEDETCPVCGEYLDRCTCDDEDEDEDDFEDDE